MSDVDAQHLRLLEAVLFASEQPLSETLLADRLPDGAEIGPLIAALREAYAARGVNLVRVGQGWAFRTATDLAPQLRTERVVTRKLSRAAMETLAIIAYHQPVTRAEIEEIRGVGLSRGTLDTLFEAGWVRPKGRRRTPGRPVTWGTTEAFLDHFALESLDDLPGLDELKSAGLLDARPAIQTPAAAVPVAAADDADEDENEPLGEDEEPLEPLDPDDGEPMLHSGEE